MFTLALSVVMSAFAADWRSIPLECRGGSPCTIGAYSGKPTVVLLEDRDSNQQNEPLKKELGEHARSSDLADRVALVAVADLGAYAFWPANDFARAGVAAASRSYGIDILIDWKGDFADAGGFEAGKSHVVVLGADGRTLARYEGPMTIAQRREFFEIVRAAAGGSSSASGS